EHLVLLLDVRWIVERSQGFPIRRRVSPSYGSFRSWSVRTSVVITPVEQMDHQTNFQRAILVKRSSYLCLKSTIGTDIHPPVLRKKIGVSSGCELFRAADSA